MTKKTAFAPAEWTKIIQAPLLAGFAVIASEPASFARALQEGFAQAGELAKAGSNGAGDGLIGMVAEEIVTSAGRAEVREGVGTLMRGARPEEFKTRTLEALQEIAQILDAKAPDEARRFKEWLARIARKVAVAGAGGGFLGFGDTRVSDSERATVSEISKLLNVAQPA